MIEILIIGLFFISYSLFLIWLLGFVLEREGWFNDK